jgi:hypothetical protein
MIVIRWIGGPERSGTVPANCSADMEPACTEAWTDYRGCFIVIDEPVDGGFQDAAQPEDRAARHEKPRFKPGLKLKVILPDGDRPATLRWR